LRQQGQDGEFDLAMVEPGAMEVTVGEESRTRVSSGVMILVCTIGHRNGVVAEVRPFSRRPGRLAPE
jgi:hypothetical protein